MENKYTFRQGECVANITLRNFSASAQERFTETLAAELFKTWKEGGNGLSAESAGAQPARETC